MTAAMPVMLALRTSIFSIVSTREDVLYLVSRPGRLSRSPSRWNRPACTW
jgi:hypothetical protein